ncbi:DVU_1557 family redox protein [Oryzibacter oryziterrae]|uniref:DVU_1557 family redox protein n=1 Tax=Oryzibacter oryziterrae TaxID=2766474 RepID=UPI001F2079F4|nr:CLJU_RS11820 family redox protein [Oryzibacter oryziterrae]
MSNTIPEGAGNPADLLCFACDVPLEMGKVEATYLGQKFPVDLPRCPKCGFVYVSEDLALGKMLRVEQALEDK